MVCGEDATATTSSKEERTKRKNFKMAKWSVGLWRWEFANGNTSGSRRLAFAALAAAALFTFVRSRELASWTIIDEPAPDVDVGEAP
jgi:hypothetical protein